MSTHPARVQGLRTQNRRAILTAIRNQGATARVDIARATGISAATVTSITADLVAEGLVEETLDTAQARGGGRGRPRELLRIRPGAALVAGAKVSTDHVIVSLTDYAGRELSRGSEAMPAGCMPEAATVAALVHRAALAQLAQLGRGLGDLAAIGVGLPGFVHAGTGVVHWSACFHDRDVNFLAMLKARFACPVFLDNDANLVALAEKWFGYGRGRADFAVVTIEHGVGLGVVLGGEIFRGARGIGAELGHVKVQNNGALCRCGQRGCLEAYVADYALAREAAVVLRRDPALPLTLQSDLDALFAAAEAGDPAARSILRRAGSMFAMGLASLVNLFDPSLIIFSGEQMRYDFLYGAEVLEQMQALTAGPGRAPPEVRIHKWGEGIWARGAAAAAMEGITDGIGAVSRTNGAARIARPATRAPQVSST